MPKRNAKKRYFRQGFKTRAEWLNERCFGGSTASAIVSMNPWKSPLELYLEIKGEKPKDADNEILKYGREAEPLIRKLFALDFPEMRVIAPRGFEMFRRTDKPYLTATVDGRTIDGAGRRGILEIKTHEIRNRDDLAQWTGSLPKNYLIQILHYLLVLTDHEYADLVGKLKFFDYDGSERKLSRTEIRYYHIERSDVEKELQWLEAEETKFYEENVLKGIPPQIEIKF